MKKELFNIIYTTISNIPIDHWKHENIGRCDTLFYKNIRLTQDGRVQIDNVQQILGWFQNRKTARLYLELEAEIATRSVQRTCDIA